MNCEGPPGAVHGGCLATTLDNVFGWQSSRVMGFGCVTLNLNVNYKKFVKLGGMVRVEVKTEKIDGRKLYMAGKLTNNISTIEDPQDVVIHCDSTALFYKRVPQAWTYDQAVKLFGPQSKLSQEEIVSILKHANQQSVHQQRLESNEQIVSKL
jgi:acyl-coenzyme A thioesterase PaaI-like protein